MIDTVIFVPITIAAIALHTLFLGIARPKIAFAILILWATCLWWLFIGQVILEHI